MQTKNALKKGRNLIFVDNQFMEKSQNLNFVQIKLQR